MKHVLAWVFMFIAFGAMNLAEARDISGEWD